MAHLQHAAMSFHAASEGEQLLHHRGAALRRHRGGVDDLEIWNLLRVFPEEVERQHDRREHVVQVMRDASGERADALESLRAQELLLDSGTLLFGGETSRDIV